MPLAKAPPGLPASPQPPGQPAACGPVGAPARLAFGPFELDLAGGRLLRDGTPVPLAPRPYAMLLYLVQRPGRLVSKEELLDAVWGTRHVTEAVLKSAANTLRQALGEDAQAPRWITTVPRRGYRFESPAEAAHPAPPATTPPPAPKPGNLPLSPGPLIGRERDLAELQAAMAAHRLVTLAGPGGVGKTRLAVAAAHDAHAADGVGLVRLDNLADAGPDLALLVASVARALNLGQQAAAGTDALAQAMARLDVLLVLDNAEHLLDPVATLARRLLDASPGLRLLVTSQVPLRLSGEQVLRLGPLAVPAEPDAADAPAHGAVALFLQRVRALQPDFEPGPGELAEVVRLCAALDGMPLALELAAARVPLLGVAGVHERLSERLGQRLALLNRGARDAAQRHRTLRAALEWSHALLTPAEQRVLRRLSVLAGSFGIETALAVAGEPGEPEADLLDLLDALQDRSLLQPQGGQRLRMFESVRSLGAEQLDLAGERLLSTQRLADWVARRFAQAHAQCHQTPVLDWVAALLPELEHLRAALQHLNQAAPEQAVALWGASAMFWCRAGLHHEGWRWCQDLRGAAQAEARKPLSAAAAAFDQGQGTLLTYAMLGELEEVHAAVVRAELQHAALGQRLDQYFDLYLLHQLKLRLEPAFDRLELWQRMVALEQPDWPDLTRRFSRLVDGLIKRSAGDIEGYRRYCLDELPRARRAGDLNGVWASSYALALAETDAGRPQAALAVLEPAVREIDAHGRRRDQVQLVRLWGTLVLAHGDLVRHARDLRDALALARADGTLWWLALALPLAPLRQGRVADAARLHGWAEALTRRRGEAPGLLFARLRQQAIDGLSGALEPAQRQELEAAGSRLDEDAAIALALG